MRKPVVALLLNFSHGNCKPWIVLLQNNFLLLQMRSFFLLLILIKSIQLDGIIFDIDGLTPLKVVNVDYNACIPKNSRHDFINWQTHLGLLWNRFTPTHSLSLTVVWSLAVEVGLRFVHGNETPLKLVYISVELRQIILAHDWIWCRLWAKAVSILRKAFTEPY